jgi:hypothetical protein
MLRKTVAVGENLNGVLPSALAVGVGLVRQSTSVQTERLIQPFYHRDQLDHHAVEEKRNVI